MRTQDDIVADAINQVKVAEDPVLVDARRRLAITMQAHPGLQADLLVAMEDGEQPDFLAMREQIRSEEIERYVCIHALLGAAGYSSRSDGARHMLKELDALRETTPKALARCKTAYEGLRRVDLPRVEPEIEFDLKNVANCIASMRQLVARVRATYAAIQQRLRDSGEVPVAPATWQPIEH